MHVSKTALLSLLPHCCPSLPLQVLTDVYQSLFLMRENCRLGKSELLLGSCRQRLVFVPGV